MSRPQNARRAQRRSQRAQNGRQDRGGIDPQLRNHARQMVDKYRNLAREALAAGDHVQAESYFQHADHYQRILNELQEAQRARQAEARARQQARQQDRQDRQNRQASQDRPAAPPPREADQGEDAGAGRAQADADPPSPQEADKPAPGARAEDSPTDPTEAAAQSVNGAACPSDGDSSPQTKVSPRKRSARASRKGNGRAGDDAGKTTASSRRRKSRATTPESAETDRSAPVPGQDDPAESAGDRPSAGE